MNAPQLAKSDLLLESMIAELRGQFSRACDAGDTAKCHWLVDEIARLKRQRRPEVVEQLEKERLERAHAA